MNVKVELLFKEVYSFNMNSKLAVGLALFLSGIATQLGGLEHGWIDVTNIKFVAGMMVQLSGFILAVWGGIETKPPRNKDSRERDSDKENKDDKQE